jgi:TPR repeat protein
VKLFASTNVLRSKAVPQAAMNSAAFIKPVAVDWLLTTARRYASINSLPTRETNGRRLTSGSFMKPGGLSLNEAEAAKLYSLAAERGHPNAQNKLAMFYELGRG